MTSSISVSLVTHGHGQMVVNLLRTLVDYVEVSQIIITKNIPENLDLPPSQKIIVVENSRPIGFGSNHNQAFLKISNDSTFFCVLNPDIILTSNPFPALIRHINDNNSALAAPLVLNTCGELEDSARFFPTIGSLLKKLILKEDGRHLHPILRDVFHPEWVAGMFMLFRSKDYRAINGFDERFFLYYEDVDICARLWLAKFTIILCRKVSVIHDARRASRKSIKFLKWHLSSMFLFLIKYSGRLPSIKNSHITNE